MAQDPTQRAAQIVTAVLQRLHASRSAFSAALREYGRARDAFDPVRDAFRAAGGATTARDRERRRRGIAPRSEASGTFDRAEAVLQVAIDAANLARVAPTPESASHAAYRVMNGITDPQAQLVALLSCDNSEVRLATQIAMAPTPEPTPPAPRRTR